MAFDFDIYTGFERGQALLSLGKVQSSGLFGGVRFVEVVNIFFTV